MKSLKEVKKEQEKTQGHERSKEWPKVRREFLKKHPSCAVCSTEKSLQVHHINAFHTHPELELLEKNLIVLCEGMERNCHRMFGHLENYKSININVREDAQLWAEKIKNRP